MTLTTLKKKYTIAPPEDNSVFEKPKKFKAKSLIVVAEDEEFWKEEIVNTLREVFGDSVEIYATDTYTEALDKIKANIHRLCGVVSDVNYYEKPDSQYTERCGLWLSSDLHSLAPPIPIILESNADYSSHIHNPIREAFILKKDIKEKGPELFRRMFRVKDLQQ